MDHHFTLGDRVRTIKPLRNIATDRLGTVMRGYPAPGIYAIQFDGERILRAVAADSLALQRQNEGAQKSR